VLGESDLAHPAPRPARSTRRGAPRASRPRQPRSDEATGGRGSRALVLGSGRRLRGARRTGGARGMAPGLSRRRDRERQSPRRPPTRTARGHPISSPRCRGARPDRTRCPAVADGGGHLVSRRQVAQQRGLPRGHEAEVGEAAGDLLEDHWYELGRGCPGGQGASDRRRRGEAAAASSSATRAASGSRSVAGSTCCTRAARVEPAVPERGDHLFGFPAGTPRASSRAETWSARPSAGG